MKNVLFLLLILPFLTLQSCIVPEAPCDGCEDGNNGNGYDNSQLYRGDVVTCQVMAKPTGWFGLSLDNNWDNTPDFTGYVSNGQIIDDICYVWNTGYYPVVTGYVTRVNPIDVKVTGVITSPGKMEPDQEFELDGETYVLCLVTKDLKGIPLQNGKTILVLRLKSKISDLQNLGEK